MDMNGTYVGKLALAGRLAVTAFFVLLSSRTLYAQTEISAETSAVYTDHQPGEDDKNGVIKGKISTADGEAAAYVSVVLKGTHKGTLTAADGSFSLHNVRPGSYTLVVSHAGLQTLEKKLTVDDGEVLVLTLSLKENARQMDEVVINGRKNVNSTPVTAGKLPVATRDLPQSVQIIGNQVINDQQGNRLSDIMKNVNGVALGTTRGAVSETFYARGYSLGSNNILKNGSRTSAASMPEASTLESVEVLKGSAALLYGGVTGGAVVNLVTKKPKFNYGGEISFRTGSYDFYKPTVDLYGPISEKLAFRVVGTYEKSGSYRETVFSKRYYINPSLLYKISDKTSLLLQTDFLNTNFRPDFGIGTIDGKLIPVNEIDRGAYYNTTWAYNKVKQNNTSLNLDHRINDSWNLNFIGAYQSYDRNYFGADRIAANDKGDVARNLTRTVSHEKTYTGQVNFIGQEKTGNIGHTLLIGIDGEATNTVTNAFKFPTFYDSINIVDRSKLFPEGYRMRTDMPVTPVTGYTKTPTYRFGAYVQDLIALSTRFKVLAGLRWSYQESPQKTVYDNATQVLSREGEHKIDKAFSPKLGLVYQPFTFLSTFASWIWTARRLDLLSSTSSRQVLKPISLKANYRSMFQSTG
jgi:iron complex outermembrane receptor protein